MILKEYHHAYDNGLATACLEIAKFVCYIVSEGWSPLDEKDFPFETDAIGEKIELTIRLAQGDFFGYRPYAVLYVGYDVINETLESGSLQRLSSLIYHELGHMTNVVKSDSTREVQKDFDMPLFLGMKDDEYKELSQMIYRFYTREMKARCFETTMFLKQNVGRNITLQEIYDDRCSDITMMRRFIAKLSDLANSGEENDTMKIISSFFNRIYGKNYSLEYQHSMPFEKKGEMLLKFFSKRLIWFKRRIDKIYYDYLSATKGYNKNEQSI